MRLVFPVVLLLTHELARKWSAGSGVEQLEARSGREPVEPEGPNNRVESIPPLSAIIEALSGAEYTSFGREMYARGSRRKAWGTSQASICAVRRALPGLRAGVILQPFHRAFQFQNWSVAD